MSKTRSGFNPPKTKPVLTEDEQAALANKLAQQAIPKVKRTPPFKAINIPFTEDDYNQLLAAAKSDNRLPTSFIKAAIKTAIDKRLAKQ